VLIINREVVPGGISVVLVDEVLGFWPGPPPIGMRPVFQFLQSTYEAGADLGGWDGRALEPAELPRRPARRPWSLGR
jgi:hypothetical protein